MVGIALSFPFLTRSPGHVPAADPLAALQGTWTTGPLAREDVLSAVREGGGDTACATELLGAASTLQWAFVVEGDRWRVLASADDGPSVDDRAGFLEFDGSTLRLTEPDGPATTTFGISLDSDRLNMTLVELSASGEDGACDVRAEALAQLSHPMARAG